MDIYSKRPDFSGKNIILILLLSIGLLIPGLTSQEQIVYSSKIELTHPQGQPELITIQENTLLSPANPLVTQKPIAQRIQEPKLEVVDRIIMTITAYSSTPDQTDSTPFITASNSWVRKGVVANNWLSFGTRIRIPEYFGDKIFIVEDRMHWRKSDKHVDVWFPSRQEAINFGITSAYVEVLKD